MSAAAVESAPWSNRRWFWTVVLVFAGHVGSVWLLSEAKKTGSSQSVLPSRVRFGSETVREDRFGSQAALSDPTLFALANPHGFSGEAWLRMQPFPYEMTNRLESPRWLADPPGRLAAGFLRFAETNFAPAARLAERPPPLLLPAVEISVPMRIQASLQIQGNLADRRLISSNALPEPDPGAVPTNCVVRVAVSPEGHAFSPIVWSSSGYPAIDKKALSYAKSARFEPVRPGTLTDLSSPNSAAFGTLVFQWSLVPAPATGGPAAGP